MDADYRRTSERLRKEIEAEGGLQWDARPSDMVGRRCHHAFVPRRSMKGLTLQCSSHQNPLHTRRWTGVRRLRDRGVAARGVRSGTLCRGARPGSRRSSG